MNLAPAPEHTFRIVDSPVLYFGTPVVLISSLNEDDTINLAPMSSAWWVGQSAMLGLDASSQTTLNLRRNGECVLNLASSDMVNSVDRLALFTGTPVLPPHKAAKGYESRRDKFEIAGLSPLASDLVTAPRVAQCAVQLEARLTREHPFAGDGTSLVAFEMDIIRVHIAETMMADGSDRYIDPQRWDPLIMKFCEFYGHGQHLHESRLAHGWSMPALASTPNGLASCQ
jgi:flavin reductase (DIM6/NTAB) family NADH-FMN oxidoreductase RutF